VTVIRPVPDRNIEPLFRYFPKDANDWPPDSEPENPASIGRVLVE
jgi:hypothetical protein